MDLTKSKIVNKKQAHFAQNWSTTKIHTSENYQWNYAIKYITSYRFQSQMPFWQIICNPPLQDNGLITKSKDRREVWLTELKEKFATGPFPMVLRESLGTEKISSNVFVE